MKRGAAVLACLLLAGLAAASTIHMEHSLDGGRSWSSAGHLTVLASGHAGTAVLEREPLSAAQSAQLAALAASGGAYRLRVPSSAVPGAPHVASSFPARCLAAASADHGLELALLDARHVAALALNAPCSAQGAAVDAPQLPATQALALRLPAAAPEVLPPLVGQGGPGMPAQPDPVAAAAAAAAAAGQAGARGGQQQQGGQAGAAGGKRAPPPDDRTWLQKNWMLVLPLGFIVMNLLGQAAGPQQGPQQRPGAGGAAPVRVARG